MALLQTTGVSPDGTSHPIPIAGIANSNATPLAANASWDSGILYYNGNESAHFSIQADVAGSYMVKYYKGGNEINFTGNSTPYDPALVTAFQGALSGKGDAFKIIYTNGPVAQTAFYIEIRFADVTQETLRSIGIPMSATNLGSSTHAVIEGRENSAGVYKQNTVTTNGAKIGLDVNVTNQPAATDVSALAKSITQTDGTQKTQVTNFPATQPVSGTVAVSNQPTSLAVSNFPSTQPISGSVAVSNLPATQAVSGTVAVSNQPTTIAVSNFPATQPISGSVNVANFPVTQVPPTAGAKQTLTIAANATVSIAANTARKGVVIASSSGTLLIALGFTATATDWTYRIVTNGIAEIPELWSGVSISIFASAASTGTATLLT